MVARIPLHNGMVALVDDEDASRVLKHRWHAKKSQRTWYAATNIYENGRWHYVRLHRFLLSARPGQIVDHIDGEGLNCQRHNMRFASAASNAWNRRPQPRELGREKRSRFKGVVRSKNGKWEAHITHLGVTYHLGTFEDEERAAVAYDQAAIRMRGDYARLNFQS